MSDYEKMLAIVEASSDDPIVKDIIRLVRERNKANAEIVRLHGLVEKYAGGFRRGAEAMRRAAVAACDDEARCHREENRHDCESRALGASCAAARVECLPIPEDK